MSKKSNNNLLPPVQLALFSGIAGSLVNSILKNIGADLGGKTSEAVIDDPNGTVILNRKAVRNDNINVEDATEQFVIENCPYIESKGNARYYIMQSVNIGRYPHNDIQLTDETVSRVHCRIFVKNGRYYLIDMGATSPAKLNGKVVENSRPNTLDELFDFELVDGDKIMIGKSEFVFHKPEIKDKEYNKQFCDYNATVILD